MALADGLVEDRPVDRRGAGRRRWPASRRIAGRTNSSKVTTDDTGLPGSPKSRTGAPPPAAARSRTRTACRAGPRPARGRSARSSSIAVLHDVVRADRDAARHDDARRRRRRARSGGARSTSSRSSGAIPRSHGLRAGRRRRGPRRPGPLASGMPAGPSGTPGAADLVAGGQDRDPRPAMDRDPVHAGARERGRPRPAVIAVPGLEQGGPGREVAAGARGSTRPTGTGSWTRHAAGSGPVASRPREPAAPAASSGVVASTGTTASAPAGSRAPVAIRTAVPGRTSTAGRGRRPRTSPMTSRRTGAVLGRAGDVGGADRVAVHRGVGPGRQRRSG